MIFVGTRQWASETPREDILKYLLCTRKNSRRELIKINWVIKDLLNESKTRINEFETSTKQEKTSLKTKEKAKREGKRESKRESKRKSKGKIESKIKSKIKSKRRGKRESKSKSKSKIESKIESKRQSKRKSKSKIRSKIKSNSKRESIFIQRIRRRFKAGNKRVIQDFLLFDKTTWRSKYKTFPKEI